MKTDKKNYQKASNVLQRLPIHQQLLDSQSALGALIPTWILWAKKNLSVDVLQHISITHFHDNELNFECQNSVIATQIQRYQKTLLTHFHQHGFIEVKKIIVRIAHEPTQQGRNSTLNEEDTQSKQFDNSIIDSVRSCQNNIKNQQLKESLERLSNTLNTLKGS